MIFEHSRGIHAGCSPTSVRRSHSRVAPGLASAALDPAACRHRSEVGAVLRVVVTNQKLWQFPKRRRLPQLLRDPIIRRRPRDTDMHDAPRAKLRDEEGEERAEEDIMELQEVTGPDVLIMVPDEGCPGLTTGSWRTCQSYVPLHGPFRDLDTDFQEFTLNAFGTP